MTPDTRTLSLRLLLGLALLAVSFCASTQQMYRWKDSSGKIHYTDTPPPPLAREVQKRSGTGNIASGGGSEPYALQEARKKAPVKLYSMPGCEPCDQARKLLNARGVPFSEVSVTDASAAADLKTAVGSMSLPAIVVGGIVQKGFEEGLYHRTLDAAGYPKAGILPPRRQEEPKPDEPDTDEAPPAQGPYAPRR